MSLSDYLKYLRARNGGLTPWEIAEGSGVPAREIHLIEVKHRRVGDDQPTLQNLARFFKVPLEEFTSRQDAYRKRLTTFLTEYEDQPQDIVLKLEGGEEVSGTLEWYSREAIALNPTSGDNESTYIVQRAWVADWRTADSPRWEVKDASGTAES